MKKAIRKSDGYEFGNQSLPLFLNRLGFGAHRCAGKFEKSETVGSIRVSLSIWKSKRNSSWVHDKLEMLIVTE